MTTSTSNHDGNVIDLFSGEKLTSLKHERIIRLSPEFDGLSMLYSNSNSNKFYAMKILCWALRANNEVVGLVPWMNGIIPCHRLNDPIHGQWEGYYDPDSEDVFSEAPQHKVVELTESARYFDHQGTSDTAIIQEIPDTIGTHAMLDSALKDSLILTEVLSWQLYGDGSLHAMLINEHNVSATPVLPGDDCLYPADTNPCFRYFFQHHIANQIKSEDPEALAAIQVLFDH